MQKKDEKPVIKKTKVKKDALKPQEDNELHKGYNEKNPAQPQGTFTPDSKTDKQ